MQNASAFCMGTRPLRASPCEGGAQLSTRPSLFKKILGMGRGINQRALLFLQAVIGDFLRAAVAVCAVGVAHFQQVVADEVSVAAAVVVQTD